MDIDETVTLPTFENHVAALLHAHGIDMEPGEYVVRQARYMRRLARLGYGPETLEATPAFLDRQPELLLDDAFGPAPVAGNTPALPIPDVPDDACGALPGE
jgi:hypothetical protein